MRGRLGLAEGEGGSESIRMGCLRRRRVRGTSCDALCEVSRDGVRVAVRLFECDYSATELLYPHAVSAQLQSKPHVDNSHRSLSSITQRTPQAHTQQASHVCHGISRPPHPPARYLNTVVSQSTNIPSIVCTYRREASPRLVLLPRGILLLLQPL